MAYNLNAVLTVTNKMSSPLKQATKSLDNMKGATSKATDGVKNFNKTAKNTSAIDNLTSKVTKMVGAFAGMATIKKVVGDVFESSASMEQYRATLNIVMKDTELAGKKIAQAKDFANRTPFETEDIVQGMVKLESYGISSTETVMTQIGDMAGVMGKSYDQAVEAIADAQTGELERLKEFGITKNMIVEQGAKTMAGIELVNNKGQITNQEKFNEALFQLMEERYKGGMEIQAKTAKGAKSTMQGMISNILSILGGVDKEGNVIAGGLLDTISKTFQKINAKLQELQDNGTIDKITQKINEALAIITEKVSIAFDFIMEHKDKIIFGLKALAVAFLGVKTASLGMSVFENGTKMFGKFQEILPKVATHMGIFNTKSGTMLGKLGSALNPIKLITKAFNGIKSAILGLPTMFTGLISKLGGFFVKLGGFFVKLGGFIVHPTTALKALKGLGLNALKALGTGLKAIFSPATIVIGVIAIFVGAVIHLWRTNENFRNKVIEIWGRIKESIKGVIASVVSIIQSFKAFLDNHQEEVNAFKEALAIIWEAISRVIGAVVIAIMDIISGIVDIFAWVIDLIADICSGDWSKVWEDIKKIPENIINWIKRLWGDMVDFFTNNPIIATVKEKFSDDKSENKGTEVGHNAKGTNNWRGGLTWVNEKGGELMNLPNGTQIIPHDLSEMMIKQNNNKPSSINIAKLADQIVVREEADIDRIADSLANKLMIKSMQLI